MPRVDFEEQELHETSPSSSLTKRWATNTKNILKKMKIPFREAPSLIDKTRPYFSGVRHFGIKKFGHFFQDPFHTMLNMPWGRFVLLFFATYIVEFLFFAFIFYIQGDSCVIGMDGQFSHALWLSSRTASTLGYDSVAPNPDCAFTNVCVMFEVIASSLVNFIILGLVFARFSAPFKRASTVRFSKEACVHIHPSGYWCLSMRVSNLRKHQILQPTTRMVVTAVDSITPSNYMFEHLKVENTSQQETNLELGFPANLVHVITPDSFLYSLSLLEMDTRMMEVLVFVDGIDAMTSKHMSARTVYSVSGIKMNEMHTPLHLEMRGKQLGLDFREYDSTVVAWPELNNEIQAEVIERGPRNSGMWTLRHQTFKKLTERFAHLPKPKNLLAETCEPEEVASVQFRSALPINGGSDSATNEGGPSTSGLGLGLGALGETVCAGVSPLSIPLHVVGATPDGVQAVMPPTHVEMTPSSSAALPPSGSQAPAASFAAAASQSLPFKPASSGGGGSPKAGDTGQQLN